MNTTNDKWADWAKRWGMEIAVFARTLGVSRSAMNTWRAPRDKPYATDPRPETLVRMADRADEYAETYARELRKVAAEIRAEAERA